MYGIKHEKINVLRQRRVFNLKQPMHSTLRGPYKQIPTRISLMHLKLSKFFTVSIYPDSCGDCCYWKPHGEYGERCGIDHELVGGFGGL